jgi:hypothetical protein
MLDPEGSDTGNEWIELYNPTENAVELRDLSLVLSNAQKTTRKAVLLSSGRVSPGQHWVLGDVRGAVLPPWIQSTYADGLGALPNTAGVLSVQCENRLLDEVSWSSPSQTGRSWQFDSASPLEAVANDAAASWCDTPASQIYFAANSGTPGAKNLECVPEAALGTCFDSHSHSIRPVMIPQRGDLLITEVMANPTAASNATGAWLEIFATKDVDLNEVSLASSTRSTRISSSRCLTVSAKTYAVLARNANAFVNGDLPPVLAEYSLAFSSLKETLRLYRGDAGIDETSLGPSAAGISWQLDPERLARSENEAPNNYCLSTRPWRSDAGGDFGSPGAPNFRCP